MMRMILTGSRQHEGAAIDATSAGKKLCHSMPNLSTVAQIAGLIAMLPESAAHAEKHVAGLPVCHGVPGSATECQCALIA